MLRSFVAAVQSAYMQEGKQRGWCSALQWPFWPDRKKTIRWQLPYLPPPLTAIYPFSLDGARSRLSGRNSRLIWTCRELCGLLGFTGAKWQHGRQHKDRLAKYRIPLISYSSIRFCKNYEWESIWNCDSIHGLLIKSKLINRDCQTLGLGWGIWQEEENEQR